MRSFKQINATEGPLLSQILLYAFPLLLSTLVQQLFNSVDIAVLSNMADTTSVASVGATSSVVGLLMYIFIGITTGTSILLARAIGSKNADRVARIVDTAVIFAVAAGGIVAIIGWFLVPQIMTWVNCPPDCYAGSVLYLRVYLVFAPAVLLQNFGCTMLNTSGNTRSPLIFMLAGGTLKVVLNVGLCLMLSNKVLAVALATAFSQVLWAVFALHRLVSGKDAIRFHLCRPMCDIRVLGQIMAQGLPISLYKALFPLSNLQIQTAINSFGSVVVAGNSGALAMENIANAFSNTFGTCASVFVGQNLGAEKNKRVWRSFWCCIGVSMVVVNTLGIGFYSSGRFWLRLLLADSPESIECAMTRLSYTLLFYGIAGLNAVLSQTVQSFGYSLLSSLNSIVFILCFRVGWMAWVYPSYPAYETLVASFLISWTLVLITNILMTTVIFVRFRKGKYKKL